MKKKTRAIIAIILLVVLVLGGASGYLLLAYQPKATVNDRTADAPQSENLQSAAEEDTEEEQNVATFSSGVNIFTESDADDINNAISSYQITNMGLILEMDTGTPMDDLGVGDIFYLEGDSSTPLGETYIGKITSVSEDSGDMTYVIDDPAVDEVFDVLNINCSEVLSPDNISTIETVEGVTMEEVDSVSSYFTGESADSGYTVTNLSASGGSEAVPLGSSGEKDRMVFNLSVDLLKVMGLDDSDPTEFQEKYDYQEGSRITVYTTTTGSCYHRETCPCVGRSKFEQTLASAVDEGFAACFLCNPPLLSDYKGNYNFEPSLKLTGKLGVEDITCDLIFDWDILNGEGLENFAVDVSGNFILESKLEANLELEFGGRTTTITLPFESVKLQALSEKLIPIAFVGYNGATAIKAFSADELRMVTSAVPLTIGFIVYVDASGKVSLSSSVYFNYTQPLEYSSVIVENGEWVFDDDFSAVTPGKVDLGLQTELSGDTDIHVGASIMLYVFNLNPAELVLFQVGTEAEGTLKVNYSLETQESTDDMISASYYLRTYVKVLQLNVNLKMKVNIWKAISYSANISCSLTLLDKTIAEWGSKSPTRYNSGEMSYTVVTAKDANNIYYKDTNGYLIKETGGYRTTLYTEDFFTICGIDESFIYVLRNNPEVSGTHNIYRVSVHDGTSKKVVGEITNCLTMDETYLYYVSNFDANTIMRIDRNTLKEDRFYSSENEVRYMDLQDDGYYVVTEKYDTFSWLFGAELYYTLLTKDGMVAASYGTNPAVTDLLLSKVKNFYQATKMVSNGYLRSSAEYVYWLSGDKTASIKAEGVSGWHSEDVGIFTTQNSTSSEGAPYSIVLYQAADGQPVTVTDVYSNQAFFTLCQSSNGTWYFFDETEDSLILYSMNSSFGNKTVVKTFSLAELPYSLNSCGMTIMNDRIYFYTIPDNTTSQVLYRYNIV